MHVESTIMFFHTMHLKAVKSFSTRPLSALQAQAPLSCPRELPVQFSPRLKRPAFFGYSFLIFHLLGA